MRSALLHRLFLATSVAWGAAVSAVLAELPPALPEFAHASSDLVPDPAVRYGRLDNGLRYAVRAHTEPRGRASLRLLVEAGSLHETEDQRGLAHYLEHMAFNGTTHYPPGTLIEFFQRNGMSFGGDTNASTGFDRTLYLLELADTRPETLDESLRVLSDYAAGMLLTDEEIDLERGIILSEERARDTAAWRLFVAQLQFLFAGTLFPERLPIGLVPVIETAHRAQFVDYYNTWYRPELTAVIAVGDFDAADVEERIRTAFAEFAPRAPARPLPARGAVAPVADVVAAHHHEPESPNTLITVNILEAWVPPPDSRTRRLEPLARNLAHAMLNRRFAEIVRRGDAPFLAASASTAFQYDIVQRTSLTIRAEADAWERALAAAEQELRRALEHGFDASELAEVKAATLNRLEVAARTAPTRLSRTLAEELASDLLNDLVTLAPADELALFRPALEAVTPAECLAALRAAWAPEGRRIFVGGNAVIPDGPAAVVAAYAASRAVPVAPPPVRAEAVWAYAAAEEPGAIEHRADVADLGITQVRFANGVRLNVKRTDFEAGSILLAARVGDGQLSEPAAQPGLARVADAVFDRGGLGAHDTETLARLFAGRNARVGLSIRADHLAFDGSATPEDLGLLLELLAAKLTDPGYRPEALRLAHRDFEQMYREFRHTASGPLAREVAPLLAGGDPRFGTPPREVLLARTLEEVRAWLDPQLRGGDLEVALAGDLDVETTIALAARTLGRLPPRAARHVPEDRLVVRFPQQPFARSYTIESALDKALAVAYWPATDGIDVATARRLSLLRAVLADRVRVRLREELGVVYSAGVSNVASDVFPGYGYFTVRLDIDPARGAEVVEAVRALSAEIAANGLTEDEVERARLPILTSLRQSARTNTYWAATVLARAQARPEVLQWAREREADFAAATRDELDALARAFLAPDRLSHVLIVPTASPATATGE